jgi:hypothetical protein
MRPQTITLSKDLRNFLETAFATIKYENYDPRETMLWAEMLFSTATANGNVPPINRLSLPQECQQLLQEFHTDEKYAALREEIYALNAHIIAMQTGTGTPVLHINGLPKEGKRFFNALMQIQRNNISLPNTSSLASDVLTSRFHQDFPYGTDSKTIRGLFCDSPGNPAAPTIFVDSNDIINTMLKQQKIQDAGYHTATELSAALMQVQIPYMPGPLLSPNPNAKYNNDKAPHHIIIFRPNQNRTVNGREDAEILHNGFYEALSTLYDDPSNTSVSLEENSIVIWNDRFVGHAKGKSIQNPSSLSASRLLYSSTVNTDYATGTSLNGSATGAHVAHLQNSKTALAPPAAQWR